MLGLYFATKNLGTLPDAGGILDQRGDVMLYFNIFSAVEAERQKGT